MKHIEFNDESSLISEKELGEVSDILQPELQKMNKALTLKYENDRASINLPDDKEAYNKIQNLIEKKRKLNPKYVVVVGIGGSNLGTIAVQEAILGKLYNQLDPPTRVLYADTVDTDLINDIISIIEPVLKRGEVILINGVSKSGGTTETISNFEILIDCVKKYHNDYWNHIIVTTDKNSKFWDLAIDKNYDVLEIPKKVGGRFSVFSSVGLFPLGLLGIDIDQLLDGARNMRDKCLNSDIKSNPAMLSASLIFLHHKKKKSIVDLFLFSTDLESIGKWYRQLMGESIGKEFDRDNKQVFQGITPTVSIGSTDLHSMAQLYLGGPFDKFTTFIKVNNSKSNRIIPDFSDYSKLVDGIQKKPLADVMDAILQGIQTAYMKGKRPFTEIILPDKSAFSVGELLQFKMMEIMYLGFLLNVNPFNQPNVESYKIETKKILEN